MLAPTGTIAFMMDCDTTGIEPDIALVKYKQLAGGGMLKIVNRTVPMALRKLGYDEPAIRGVLDYIDAHDTIEGAPGLKDEHLPVFDCAFAPPQGGRSIHFRGHLRMMAAVQPFLSGAISKTCNMPQRGDRRRHPRGLPRRLEARPQGAGDLPRRLQGEPAGEHQVRADDEGRRQKPPPPRRRARRRSPPRPPQVAAPVAASPSPPAPRRPVQPRRERLPHTRQQPDAQVRHPGPRGLRHRRLLPRRPARRAVHHDGQGRLDDRRPDGRRSGRRSRSACSTACRWRSSSTSSPTAGSSRPGSPRTRTSRSPRASPTTSSAGWAWSSSPATARPTPPSAGDDRGRADAARRAGAQGQRPPHRHHRRPRARRGRAGHATPTPPVVASPSRPTSQPTAWSEQDEQFAHFQSDAPACDNCGALTVRCGTCYRCFNCGNSMGCS